MSTHFHFARLHPPLRDCQQEMPRLFCPICGAEQYGLDPTAQWHGQTVCAPCRARLDQEEDQDLS